MACPVEMHEFTTEQVVSVTFDSVVASDNLGEPTITYATRGEEVPVDILFPADGQPKEIIATAKDSFDNEASCTFNLTVFRKGTKASCIMVDTHCCLNRTFALFIDILYGHLPPTLMTILD